ncbi:MAG: fibrobacter succinogenes major paralogous domain-containing protein [Fibromonadaceae bacterium]|jgi:uncharacterized protein (TIGR02145 family)|nr:fibrobacter succinogenes major paralogous domain-containing protein [Fibromonadaceae bacterium]
MNNISPLIFVFALCFALLLSCASIESAGKPPANSRAEAKPVPVQSSSSSESKAPSPPEIVGGQLTDSRDGKKYKITTIGTQVWMAENLNYVMKGSKCYGNNAANCNKHGRLYGWEAINENQNICPKGWHLPRNDEWKKLIDYAGGENSAGKKLKTKEGWNSFSGEDGNGTDDYDFSALAGGHGDYDGKFSYIGDISFWWSNSEDSYSEFASSWYINSRGNAKNNDFFSVYEAYFSFVRCIKD